MKPDGTYEVVYFSQNDYGEREPVVVLDIDSRKQTVRVTSYWRNKYDPIIMIIPIVEFDRRLNANPGFLQP